MTPLPHDPAVAAQWVQAAALKLGFDAVGVARAGRARDAARFEAALVDGRLEPLPYLSQRVKERLDPTVLLPGARSVVMVMMGYAQDWPAQPPDSLKVARYAARRDYHNPMIKRLRKLRKQLCSQFPGSAAYVASDTGAVLERAWAAQAGLGWVGKSAMLINTRLGTYTLLGSLITTVELRPHQPIVDHCGSCTACLTACPTQAIVAPGVVDARRCITTHTVENPSPAPWPHAPALHGWVFGCDVCQQVCPWSHRGVLNPALPAVPGLAHLPVKTLAQPPHAQRDGALEALITGTPLARAKVKGLRRNARAQSGS